MPSAPLAGLPQQRAARGVDAADARVVGACAERVADAAHAAGQVDQALHVVGTARRGDGRFPARGAVGRVDADQASADASHQRVADGDQHAGALQHQVLGGTGLRPQAPAALTVPGAGGAVRGLHEDAAAGDQRCGERLGRKPLAPQHLAALQRDEFVGGGDDRHQRAVAAHAGCQRRAHGGAPGLLAGAGVDHDHGAVAASHRHRVATHVGAERELDLRDADAPGLPHAESRLVGRQLGRLGPGRAGTGRERGSEERGSAGAQEEGGKHRTLAEIHGVVLAGDAVPAGARLLGSTPTALSLISTRRRYSLPGGKADQALRYSALASSRLPWVM